jgi:hypothetical protein
MSVADRTMSVADRTVPAPVFRRLGYTGGVRITGGTLAERIEDALDTYLGLSPDDILHGFREQAGMPAPGKAMTGWSRVTTEATFGQWISGLTRLGVTAGRPDAIERAVELVRGWWETIPEGGDHRMGGYGIEKVVCGIVDLVEFGGHRELLELIAPIAAASSEAFSRTRPDGDPIDFEGGILSPTRTLEWYTFGENFYRAWRLGAPDSVKDFADEWHYPHYWDRFAERPAPGTPWDVPVWLHAYSHLNTFATVAQLYEVSGDERWLEILRNAHEYFTTTQLYATGGYGPSELTLPEDGALGRSVEWRTDCAEIVCGSWAAFKLFDALMAHTGAAHYGDWVEQLVYSGIGAVTPVTSTGRSPYYQDYRLGIATKLPHWDDWPCCSGTYIQNVGHLADLIYYGTDDGLAVNLYVPSTVEWEDGGVTRRLVQTTSFPETDTADLEVDFSGRLALRLRVPSWSTGFSVTINGDDIEIVALPGEWATVDREWRAGDRIGVRLGAALRAIPIDRWHPNRVAFAHGPVVLAQTAEWTSPVSLPTPWEMVDLGAAFRRDEEQPLRYVPVSVGTARLPQGFLQPLSEFPDRFPYRLYFDLDAPRII